MSDLPPFIFLSQAGAWGWDLFRFRSIDPNSKNEVRIVLSGMGQKLGPGRGLGMGICSASDRSIQCPEIDTGSIELIDRSNRYRNVGIGSCYLEWVKIYVPGRGLWMGICFAPDRSIRLVENVFGVIRNCSSSRSIDLSETKSDRICSSWFGFVQIRSFFVRDWFKAGCGKLAVAENLKMHFGFWEFMRGRCGEIARSES